MGPKLWYKQKGEQQWRHKGHDSGGKFRGISFLSFLFVKTFHCEVRVPLFLSRSFVLYCIVVATAIGDSIRIRIRIRFFISALSLNKTHFHCQSSFHVAFASLIQTKTDMWQSQTPEPHRQGQSHCQTQTWLLQLHIPSMRMAWQTNFQNHGQFSKFSNFQFSHSALKSNALMFPLDHFPLHDFVESNHSSYWPIMREHESKVLFILAYLRALNTLNKWNCTRKYCVLFMIGEKRVTSLTTPANQLLIIAIQ